jgi:hypothetical protein
MNKLFKCIVNPYYGCSKVLHRIAPLIKDDELYVKLDYFFAFKKKLDLSNPQTFSEKLQWLKLNDHNPAYTMMVDKYSVKEYVGKLIGSEYVIPTLGVWEQFDDIDFNSLPEKFVLKCTHDSGGLVICKSKQNLDVAKARRILSKCLKRNYYLGTREYPYKSVKPQIIAEQYMEDGNSGVLNDYKLMCFNGQVKLVEVHIGRFTHHHTQDFYNSNWEKTNISQGGYGANSKQKVDKPKHLEKMIEYSELIAAKMAHCRVDWYEINGKLYFGEITFFHWSGMKPFVPEKWDYTFGSWIELPSKDVKI